MDNLFNSGISIEKMAAFLDGNLSESEMQGISSMIDADASLQKFMDANSVIDESISAFSLSDMGLPQELQTLDFELPSLDGNFHGLVTLSPEPSHLLDDMMVAACANAPVEGVIQQLDSEDHESFTDIMNNSDEHVAAFSDDTITTETDNTFDGLPEDL